MFLRFSLENIGRGAEVRRDETRMAKRVFDLLFSSFGLVLLCPLFGVIAILSKLDSPGPVFYRGARLGRRGKTIRMYKFRTMVADAEKLGPMGTPEGDPRVTKVGKFLRKFKLDELPQLINVWKGEMSLVGPRPEAPFYLGYYTEDERAAILSVRPGMTDYASLRFHDEGKLIAGPDPVGEYISKIKPQKVRLQLEYVRDHSLAKDVRIILATIGVILKTRLLEEKERGI